MPVICNTPPQVSGSVLWAGWKLLRQGLDRFLNGEGISKWNLLIHRGGRPPAILHCQDWMKELTTFHHTLPNPYQFHLRKGWVGISGTLRLEHMARILSGLHTTLGLMIDKGIKPQAQELCISGKAQFSTLDGWRRKMFSELRHSAQALSHFCVGYYLHGSAGEGNMTPAYSDVDTLMIIKDETRDHPDALLNLRHIDPLQHHGHLVITQRELSCYRQEYLPFELWREAVLLSGP